MARDGVSVGLRSAWRVEAPLPPVPASIIIVVVDDDDDRTPPVADMAAMLLLLLLLPVWARTTKFSWSSVHTFRRSLDSPRYESSGRMRTCTTGAIALEDDDDEPPAPEADAASSAAATWRLTAAWL